MFHPLKNGNNSYAYEIEGRIYSKDKQQEANAVINSRSVSNNLIKLVFQMNVFGREWNDFSRERAHYVSWNQIKNAIKESNKHKRTQNADLNEPKKYSLNLMNLTGRMLSLFF